jgi:ATP-binding cassette, subfamily C (CFTR/MRP), member 1
VRSAISIVPQSPDLFEGTLRENIDPVGEHSDVDIWVALDQVYLTSVSIISYPDLIFNKFRHI